MNATLSDTDIIRMVCQGNQQAYAQLVERYQSYVFTLVLRLVPTREEAEEVAQDVFVKAYRSLADFRGDSKFSTWLYQIARYTALSFLRKKRDPAVLVEEEKMILIADKSDRQQQPASMLEAKQEQATMQRAIGMLPETDAQIITLFYQHEQSLEEIGHVLGMTANNVKVRLFRSRSKLKQIISDHFSGELSR